MLVLVLLSNYNYYIISKKTFKTLNHEAVAQAESTKTEK